MTHELSQPERWLELYGDILFRYGIVRVRTTEIAEDLVQETLLAALKAKENYAGQATEQTWLIGILKHKIIDYFRKVSREQTQEFDEQWVDEVQQRYFDQQGNWLNGFSNQPTPDQFLQQEQFFKILQECIDHLPPRMARLFVLRELDGMNSEEICQLMSISTLNNFWVMLSRIRAQLRHCLELHWKNQ